MISGLFDNNLLATDDVHALGQTLERVAGIAYLHTVDGVNCAVNEVNVSLHTIDAVYFACSVYIDVVDVAAVGVGDNNVRGGFVGGPVNTNSSNVLGIA